MVDDEKVGEIIQLMEEDPDWTYSLEDYPDLRLNDRIIDAMFELYKNIYPKRELGSETLGDLLRYPEWRENERTLELTAWMMEELGSYTISLLESKHPDLLEKEVILQTIGRIIGTWKISETFCIYDVLKFIQRHEVLLNSEHIRQGLLSNTNTIGKTITNFENVCHEAYTEMRNYADFCDLLEEIKKIDFLYTDENMQRELVATVPLIVEFLIDHRRFSTGGGYLGDYVLDRILGTRAYTSHYDVQIAVFHFLNVKRRIEHYCHYSARKKIDWVERLREDDILKDSPIVQAGFYESKRTDVEFSNEDIEFILNGIRESKFPWVSFLEIQKISKLWNNKQISKLLHSRIDDIAEYIQTVRYVDSIVNDIHKDPILMRSTSIVQALRKRVNDIGGWPRDDELMVEVFRGEMNFDDMMDARGIYPPMRYEQLRDSEILRKIQSERDLQHDEQFQLEVLKYIVSIRWQELDLKKELEDLDECMSPEYMEEQYWEKMKPIYDVLKDLGEYPVLRDNKDIREAIIQLIKAADLFSFFRETGWSHTWNIHDIRRMKNSN